MSDIIKLNFPAMQEMAQHCKTVAERLMETVKLAQTIAQQMEQGALIGDTGEAFAGALNTAFCPSVTRLSQKFGEVSEDIKGAIEDIQQTDSGKVSGLFS
jgi:WXG100 family type VII secretion target